MAIFSRKNIFYLLAFSAILIAVYITFDFFTHKPELSPQFNFEAMKANSFLVVLEPEPNFYQFMLLGKNCQSVGGGPQLLSANLDLSSFVQKAILLDEYSAAVVNSQLLVTVNKATIDQSFYTRDWSSPNCAFVLEKAGL